MRVYRTNGVFRIVSMRGEAIPIPEEQIDALRTVVTQQVPWSEHPFLKIGQRVRIRGGSLEGVEGVLLSRNGDRTLIISVDAIQRSLAVRVEGYDVEASVRSSAPPMLSKSLRLKELSLLFENSMESAQILLVSKERSALDLPWTGGETTAGSWKPPAAAGKRWSASTPGPVRI